MLFQLSMLPLSSVLSRREKRSLVIPNKRRTTRRALMKEVTLLAGVIDSFRYVVYRLCSQLRQIYSWTLSALRNE
jgi:hypothetical protein